MTRPLTFLLLMVLLFGSAALRADAAVHPDFLIAQKYEAEGNFDAAIPIYMRLYESEGADIYFWRLILLYEKAGRYKELAAFTRERLAKDPGDTESTRYLARSLYALGKRDEGRKLLFDLFERDGRSRNLAVYAANEFVNQGEYDLALEVYKSARQAAGDNNMFAIESARVYEAIEKTVPAVEEYLRVIDTIPTAYQRIMNLIAANAKSGEGQQGIIRSLRAHLGNVPESIKTARILSDVLYEDGDYREALTVLSGAVALTGSHLDIRGIADRLMNDGVLDVALEAFETYARLFPEAPDRPAVLLKSAELAGDIDQPDAASKYLQQVIDDYPGTVYSAQATVLMIEGSKDSLAPGRYSEMIEEYAETTEFREAAFEAYKLLGESYLRDNRPEDAKNAFRNADIKARSEQERYALALRKAQLAFFISDNESMTQEIITAIRYRPDAPEVNELLADKVLGMRCASPADASAFMEYAGGRYALYRGDVKEAVDKLTTVADTATIPAMAAALALGDLSAASGDSTDALEWYKRAASVASDTTEIVQARLKIADITRFLPGGGTKAKDMYLDMLTTYPGTVYDEELRGRLKTMVER